MCFRINCFLEEVLSNATWEICPECPNDYKSFGSTFNTNEYGVLAGQVYFCHSVSVKKKVFWFLPELLTDWVRVTLQVLILDSTCPYVSFYSSAIKGKN